MNMLIAMLVRRLRPRVGWGQFVLALGATLCCALAAADGKPALPAAGFVWAGLGGLMIGLRLGRPGRADARPRLPTPARYAWWAGRAALTLAALLALGTLLVIAAADTLPPAALALQDLAALAGWVAAAWRRTAGWADLPAMRSWSFLAATLPRFWAELQAAPNAGPRGARLIVLAGGIAGTWASALVLGWALARERSVFSWALPTLATIGFTAIIGNGAGIELIFGLVLLLLLALAVGARRRAHGWEQSSTDYSDEITVDTLAWGAAVIMLVMVLALLIPTSLSNPIASLLWRDVELPSGIAALDRNLQRSQRQPVPVNIGISQLPALQLGQSLEGSPPTAVILRVRVGAPLPPGPWPRYWRARVFNFYMGTNWTTNANIGQFPASAIDAGGLPGAIVQEIDDLRSDRTILAALPDVLAIDLAAQGERLPDGALAALTAPGTATHYRVLSRPQELAAPPRFDGPPPDLSSYLVLPAGYPQRVADLAVAVAGSRTTPYQRALALEAYLRGLNYTYTVQPIPIGGDAVEQFLFTMRAGYCTYYASAMAVMARSLGIPARLAIGYATGEYDQASGAYLVRESDAHAWPELYIDGRWLPFEPTPIRVLPARTSGASAATPTPAPAPAEQPGTQGLLIWAVVLAIVAGLAALGLWWGRWQRPRPLVLDVQARLERDGGRAGVPWPAGATLHEYSALLAPRIGAAASELTLVVELVEQARYSGQPLPADQEGRLRRAAARVLEHLRAAQR